MEKVKKNSSIKKILALTLTFMMVFTGLGISQWGLEDAWAAAYAEGETSDYEIIIGSNGITSSYHSLDQTPHTVGTYTVSKTYIFRFTEDSFSLKNSSGAIQKKAYRADIDGTNNLGTQFANNANLSESYWSAYAFTDNTKLTSKGYSVDSSSTKFYYIYFTKLSYAILIEIIPNGTAPTPISIDALNTALTGAPSIEQTGESYTDTVYYHTDDRYNGKTTVNSLITTLKANDTIKADRDTLKVLNTSYTSFWALYEAAMTRVNAIYPETAGTRTLEDGVTQEQVDAAAKLLTQAAENLIPTTQVNATALYEAVEANKAKKDKESKYTKASWAPFELALNEAQTMLTSLYGENGKATEVNRGPAATGAAPEGAVRQEDVDAAAAALTQAQENLYTVSYETENTEKAESIAKYLPDLIEIAKSANEKDYTEGSWITFAAALEAAKAAVKPESDGLKQHVDAVASYENVFSNLYDAYYKNLVTQNSVTVNFIASNTSGARSGAGAYGVSEEVTLPFGAKLSDLLDRYDMSPSDWEKWSLVLVNDRFVSGNYTKTDIRTTPAAGDIVLHPGDKIAFAGNINPMSTQSPSTANLQAYLKQYISSIKQSRFTQENGMTAEAGKAFTINAEQLSAALGEENREWKAATGMTIFVSQPQDEQDGKAETSVLKADGEEVITGADGSASITLYKEGWYLIQAYDLAADVKGDVPNTANTPMTEGTYHSTSSGASVWVHVGASSEVDAVKSRLKAGLDEVYKAYPKPYFRPGKWDEIQTAYDTAVTGIDKAASTGDAYDAQQTGIVAIRKIQSDTTAENAKNLADFHENLEKLPDDTSLITQSVESVVRELIAVYDGMSDYQKTLLTGAELKKYEAIADAYAKRLPEAKNYSLTLNVEGDTPESTEALNNMISWLRDNTKQQDTSPSGYGGGLLEKAFSFQIYNNKGNTTSDITEAQPLDEIRLPIDVDYAAYYHVRDDQDHSISGEGWSISDGEDGLYFSEKSDLNYIVNGDLTVKINGTEYEVKSVTVDGLNDSQARDGEYTTLDYSEYKGKNKDWVNMHFSGAYKTFSMPYSDVTVTIKWGPVALDEIRTSAIGALQAAYDAYDKSLYDDSGKAALKEARDQGISNIEGAKTENAIAEARKAALAAMAAVKASSSQQGNLSYNSGNTVGKVYVSVENTTYPGSAFTGTILSGWYDLGKNDTMMTCVLKALETSGFSWEGTGGTGYGITYLSSITKGGKTLAEFSGGKKSGWMGTLNDWFTNEGFNMFSVANGKLENGDEIHVMYTCDLGVDIGGTWDNADTSLKGLSVSGGTLAPAFSSSQMEYTLMISGDKASVKLTPEAANKNYQARIFLNSYNKDSARYKRTETISVKSGDILYVGIGESGWPTMNASGSGTKYTIKVVSGSDATAVNDMINSLKDVTYGNYKSQKTAIESARAAYNALSSDAKKEVTAATLKKLTDAEAGVKFYTEIDDAKTKLNALTSTSGNSQVQAALAAYNKLSDKQKEYITKADVEKFNELAKKYNISAIMGADEMPESEVVTNGKTGAAVTESPTEVTVSGTTATASVKKENVEAILKQAKENKSAEIVLNVAASDTKGAETVEVQLDTATVKSIVSDTSASLTVKTENGQVSLDREALTAVASEAKGATITLEVVTVSKPTETQQKAAGTNGQVLQLTVKSGDKIISDFKQGKATVTVEISTKLQDKKVAAIHIAEDGKIEQLPGKTVKIDGKDYYTFETPHFSTFALVDADELGLEVNDEEANIVKIKELVSDMSLKARSSKTSKKNIKVTLTVDKSTAAAIKEIKDMGYTVKYKYYRSTKKASKYQAKITKTTKSFTNTAGKKGTRYYYKARIQVYDKDGKLITQTALKQCKCAVRMWTK